ncbi:MAG: ankyrin repeat domain-containing protein [Alphaproteobacteria bacterium]|nr:ankyrin repeat domain-containing protein [Alphaproteobacteria bacterium]
MRSRIYNILTCVALSLLLTSTAVAQDDAATSFNDNFVDAAETDNLTALKSMVKAGKPVDSQGAFQTTALMRAAYHGYDDVVKYLLNAGADPNLTDIGGATALHLATRQGHAGVAKQLIEFGAEVDAVDGEGWTPLMRAALTEKPELVDLLVKKGADINATNDLGETALMHAVMAGSSKVAEQLIYHGADETKKSKEELTAADIAYQKGDEALQKSLTLSSPVVAAPSTKETVASAPTASISAQQITAAPAATPPAPAPAYLLQLGTHTDAEEATARWKSLTAAHGKSLKGLSLVLSEVRLQAGNSFYRTQAGYLSDKAEAQKICTALYNDGVDCFVVESGLASDRSIQPDTGLPPQETAKATSSKPSAASDVVIEEDVVEIAPEKPSAPEKPVKVADAKPKTPDGYTVVPEGEMLPWLKPAAPEKSAAVVSADGMNYEPGREPRPLQGGGVFDKPADADPAPSAPVGAPTANANVKSEVEVAEAIRVPLSSTGDDMPTPRASLLPSRNSGKRSTWLQINYFPSEEVAVNFWEKMSKEHPDLTNGLRFRTSQPFRGGAGHISAQVGPMTSRETSDSLCIIANKHKLRCSPFEDIGSSASANRARDRSANLSRPQSTSAPAGTIAYWIQFGSYPSAAEAEDQWNSLSALNKDLLGDAQHRIAEPRYGSNAQPVYRLRSGPYALRLYAQDLCSKLKLRQHKCLVVRE